MNTRMTGMVATPWTEEALAEDAQAGTATWWDLDSCARSALADAWQKEFGVGPRMSKLGDTLYETEQLLPNQLSSKVRLHRAMRKLANADQRVEPMRRQHGYAILTSSESLLTAGAVDAKTSWSAWYEARDAQNYPNQPPALKLYFDAACTDETKVTLTQHLHEELARQDDVLQAADVGQWLNDSLWRFQALSLRDAGGFYFIPHKHAKTWERFTRVVQAAQAGIVWGMPVMRSPNAALAIMHALAAEIEQDAKRIEEDIEAGVGTRALEQRATRCQEMLIKLGSYEELVGTSLVELRASIGTLKGKIVEAEMHAAAEEEAT